MVSNKLKGILETLVYQPMIRNDRKVERNDVETLFCQNEACVLRYFPTTIATTISMNDYRSQIAWKQLANCEGCILCAVTRRSRKRTSGEQDRQGAGEDQDFDSNVAMTRSFAALGFQGRQGRTA